MAKSGFAVLVTGEEKHCRIPEGNAHGRRKKISCSRCGFTLEVVTCLKLMHIVNKTLIKPCRKPVNGK